LSQSTLIARGAAFRKSSAAPGSAPRMRSSPPPGADHCQVPGDNSRRSSGPRIRNCILVFIPSAEAGNLARFQGT
jgi:hypothetical protein